MEDPVQKSPDGPRCKYDLSLVVQFSAVISDVDKFLAVEKSKKNLLTEIAIDGNTLTGSLKRDTGSRYLVK
jgi:hypothetical protein